MVILLVFTLTEGSTWNVPLGLTELLLLPTRILQLTNILLEDLSTDLLFGKHNFYFVI